VNRFLELGVGAVLYGFVEFELAYSVKEGGHGDGAIHLWYREEIFLEGVLISDCLRGERAFCLLFGDDEKDDVLVHPEILCDTVVRFNERVVWREITKVGLEPKRRNEHGETDRDYHDEQHYKPWSFFNEIPEYVSHNL